MSTMMPITRERHEAKRWLRPTNYGFSSRDTVVPLVLSELPRAALAMPIGFVSHEEQYLPVALVGLAPGQNLFVSSDSLWLSHFVPSAYKLYPFALLPASEGGEVLCINEGSGLVTDGPEGELFLREDGEPSKIVADIFASLQEISAYRLATRSVCALLKAHELIQPWPIGDKTQSEGHFVDGLFCINEEALDALSDEAFLELRAARALTVAFCQLLSMQHLPGLKQMAEARAAVAMPTGTPSTKAGLEVLDHDRPLDFGRFR